MFFRSIFFALAVTVFATAAFAQNTTGVFGPVVGADDHAAEYRAALAFNEGDSPTWNQRFHYERALSGNLRLRGIVALRETSASEFDFDFIRAEAVWQITPDETAYQTGMRFEGRVRGDNRPAEIRANWLNQWDLDDGWRARAILLNTLQVANRNNDDLQFQGRFGLSRKMEAGYRLGLHSYVDLGDTNKLRVFNRNEAEIGPFVSFDLVDDVEVYIGTLHGLTGASDDHQLRFFIERAF